MIGGITRVGGRPCKHSENPAHVQVNNIVHTRKACEEICNVQDVRWVPGGIMVHLIRLSRLVFDDVEKDVDSRIAILRRGPISIKFIS